MAKSKERQVVKKRSIGWHIQREWQLYVMLLPAVAYIFIFCYVPMAGIQLAFKDYSYATGLYGGKFVGFKYFIQYFTSTNFWPTLRNTFVTSLVSIVLGFPAPIILALVINQLRNSKWKKVVQTTVYIPYFISTVVLVSMLNILLAQSNGVISNALKAIHLVPQSVNLLGSQKYFVWVYAISGVWQSMGWNSIIYIAALSSVDAELYDAAKIDGASRFQTVVHIEFPTLVPTIVILLIMNMGNILNVGFDKIYLMQNSLNLGASQVISTYVYTVGIKSAQFSFATAVGLFTNVINFIFLMGTNTISKRLTGSGLL